MSCVRWCEACCGYRGPVPLDSTPHLFTPRNLRFRGDPETAAGFASRCGRYCPGGGRSIRRSRGEISNAGRREARGQPAGSRVQAGGARPRRARRRGTPLDVGTGGWNLVPPRARTVAAGRSSPPAGLHVLRASQSGPAQLLRGMRKTAEPMSFAGSGGHLSCCPTAGRPFGGSCS